MRNFQGLSVWKKAHQLALGIYRATSDFPRNEIFGLTAQSRRAAASIPTNIAEGSGRTGDKEMLHFLSIASGSTSEVEYLLLLAKDIGYLPPVAYEALLGKAVEIRKMLYALMKRLGS